MILLAIAILFEVTGTSALRASEGFTRLWPSVVVIVSYGVSFLCLSLALKQGLSMGPAYAIWSGAGTALITLVGLIAFHDRISPLAYAGIAVIVLGVVLVNLGGGGAH
jgi:small multidrug resistance pump